MRGAFSVGVAGGGAVVGVGVVGVVVVVVVVVSGACSSSWAQPAVNAPVTRTAAKHDTAGTRRSKPL
ncbi:hypothetical protein AU188_22600 [Mycobacterium sp. IS-3022]|nr:hypothetical protein AU188_21090 [Mycobacterium sp. IS-3022]KUH97471.1 hypothetical protein AU188_22600 [Mycobacterium sp. IS-3022]